MRRIRLQEKLGENWKKGGKKNKEGKKKKDGKKNKDGEKKKGGKKGKEFQALRKDAIKEIKRVCVSFLIGQ